MEKGAATARNYDVAIAQIDPSTKRSQASTAAFGQSMARAAVASKDYAGAQQYLINTLKELTPGTTAANNVLTQLQNTLNQQEAAAKKGSASLQDLVGGVTKLVGAYVLLSGAAQSVGAAIGAGMELEKQQATFQALSGSAAAYQENLAAAKAQQALFGGSLKDTLENMSGFVILSKNTGVELSKLANLARAMAVIDPAQGFKGASVALKEFFSGDITSLARRFEIPRKELNEIKNGAGDAAEKFGQLENVLAKYGISVDVVNAQLGTTTVRIERIQGALADMAANFGQQFGAAAAIAGEAFLPFIKQINDNLTFGDKLKETQLAFLATSGSVDVFNQKVTESNSKIADLDKLSGLSLGALSADQFAMASALAATGASADQVSAAIGRTNEIQATLNDTMRQSGAIQELAWNGGIDQVNAYHAALTNLAGSSEAGRQRAEALDLTVRAQALTVSQATGLALEYVNALLAEANATQQAEIVTAQATVTYTGFTNELRNNALEAINAQLASEALKQSQEGIYNIALSAANGLMSASAAAAAMGSQFGVSTGQAYALINALSLLQAAKLGSELGISSATVQYAKMYGGLTNAKLQDMKTAKDVKKIEAQTAYQLADTAGKLAIKTQELKKLTKGTVDYAKASGEAQQLEKQLADEAERDAKKGNKKGKAASEYPKLSANEKINNKLLAQQDKYNNKFEDAEKKHLDNIAKINEEHQKKLLAQSKDNEKSKRRGRASFYASNTGEGIDTQLFAAQYEEAFAAAQKIAQEGSTKLSSEFLALRQSQIEEMRQLASDAASITANEDLTDEQKTAALAYLDGRKRLVEDAQREELDQLLKGGDDLTNSLDERLTEEEQRYAENTDKISTQAENSADAVIKSEERKRLGVANTNKELAKQIGLMGGTGKAASGASSTTTKVEGSVETLPSTEPQPITTDGTPIAVSATAPLPVVNTEAILVKQLEMFLVRDEGVIQSISDMTARLEGKLGEVVESINVASVTIANSVSRVESAITRIPIGTNNSMMG